MSRLAKKPIALPKGTTVTVTDAVVFVKGPKGELSRVFPHGIKVTVTDEGVLVEKTINTLDTRAHLGTTASHIHNMVHGVNEAYEKHLILEGVGYKVSVAGKKLNLALGFSHPVVVDIPEGIEVSVEKNDIKMIGINKETLGQFAANVRALKVPEPYKGKGLRYSDEIVLRKQGKKTA